MDLAGGPPSFRAFQIFGRVARSFDSLSLPPSNHPTARAQRASPAPSYFVPGVGAFLVIESTFIVPKSLQYSIPYSVRCSRNIAAALDSILFSGGARLTRCRLPPQALHTALEASRHPMWELIPLGRCQCRQNVGQRF